MFNKFKVLRLCLDLNLYEDYNLEFGKNIRVMSFNDFLNDFQLSKLYSEEILVKRFYSLIGYFNCFIFDIQVQ